jgi:hypothetical protein
MSNTLFQSNHIKQRIMSTMLTQIGKATTLLAAASLLVLANERDARAASWKEHYTSADPNIAHKFTPTLGTNVITIAPYFYTDGNVVNTVLSVLTGAEAAGGWNLDTYTTSSVGGGAGWVPTTHYLQGIVINGHESEFGVLAGWTVAGELWVNGTAVGGATSSFALPVSSVNFGYKTSTGHPGTGGFEIFEATNSTYSAWSAVAEPYGEQVTNDTVLAVSWDISSVNGNGVVFAFRENPQVTSNVCAPQGGEVYPVLIAVKNNVVYGLESGIVYEINTIGGPNCWTQLANPSGVTFLSIATDNGGSSVAPNFPGNDVWASDSKGNIWIYN